MDGSRSDGRAQRQTLGLAHRQPVAGERDVEAEVVAGPGIRGGELRDLAPGAVDLVALEHIDGARVVPHLVIRRANRGPTALDAHRDAELVRGAPIGGLEPAHLAPDTALVALEHVDGSGVRGRVGKRRTHEEDVAAQVERRAELVAPLAVGGRQLRHLEPCPGVLGIALVDVDGARLEADGVVADGADRRGVAVQGDGNAEEVARVAVGRRDHQALGDDRGVHLGQRGGGRGHDDEDGAEGQEPSAGEMGRRSGRVHGSLLLGDVAHRGEYGVLSKIRPRPCQVH